MEACAAPQTRTWLLNRLHQAAKSACSLINLYLVLLIYLLCLIGYKNSHHSYSIILYYVTEIIIMEKSGRTKNYLRFVHESTFGLVAASHFDASIRFLQMQNTKDRYLAVPANENIYIWDLKTKQVVNELKYDSDNAAEVTVFDCYHGGHARTNLIAVGYANGHVKVFEYETGGLKVTFTGHRTAVSALAFDKNGSRLASGGKDCNIVLWDIVSEKGLFSLKGHKNAISKLMFLYNDDFQKDLIISSSIDGVSTIKFWDLQVQHCFYTIPGQANGVWSFALFKNGSRLITGSASSELRCYSIEFMSSEDSKAAIRDESEDSSELEYGLRIKHLGNVLRNTATISNRVQDIVIDQDESFVLCHSVDKNIELYALRSSEEALTYARKQAKKAIRREAKRKRPNGEDGEEVDHDDTEEIIEKPKTINSLSSLDPQTLVDCEFNRKLGSRKLSDKIKAITLVKLVSKDGKKRYKVAVMSSLNRINTYLFEPSSESPEDTFKLISSIDNLAHRSDVRSVAISSDNSLIMSASGESVKIWRLDSKSCTATIDTESATCCVFAGAQNITANYENRFGLVGTKQGRIQIIDIFEANVVETYTVCNDNKPLNSICLLHDRSGIACGGEDQVLRFYNFAWKTITEEGQNRTVLTLEADRDLSFQESITCINISSNNRLIAVALLDSTVRVHFLDTFKYFLTMYGHKFPVTTMDISDDNNLLVTGSPDKNIKIWGLDFGDCHKSIFAHDEAITCVKFVPRTHHMFSCARDKTIKQWDCDHFIKIQTLRKHQAEIWCMSISSNGKYLVTGSHDKSLRLYRKTEEILIPTDEDETEREMTDERNVFEQQENIVVGETNLETGFASKMTVSTVKSADTLIEAIDVFGDEQEKEREYKKQCKLAEEKGEPKPPEPERNVLLMVALTNDPYKYMLEMLRRIKSSELEEILITLPFEYVRKLLVILAIFLDRRWDVELMVRCATFLMKVNFGQIIASPTLVPVICKLQSIIMDRAIYLRNCAGFNLMALEHLNLNSKTNTKARLRI